MKELSIEEKAKAYDEAKARMSRAYNSNRCTIGFMKEIFPELREESEDERIRKAIINVFATHKDYEIFFGASIKDILAWLEKQGEHKSVIEGTFVNVDEIREDFMQEVYKILNSEPTNDRANQIIDAFDHLPTITIKKPADKAEPKFKVGDWISGYYTNYKVLSVNNEGYVVEDVDENKINILFENEKFHRLWAIQDAKAGDVIYLPNGNNEYYFFIFKGIENASVMSFAHFYQYNDGTFKVEGTIDNLASVNDIFQPATKEQRDQLEKAMANAGYTFDFEKKELKKIEQKPSENKGMNLVEEEMTPFQKKVFDIIDTAIEEEQGLKQVCDELLALASNEIEQKPAWSEEDEMFVHGLIRGLAAKRDIHGHITFSSDCIDITETINWLKSIKDRVQLQPKWNEEDELHIKELESLVKRVWAIGEHENDKDTIHKMSDLSFFLKTLKPQPKQEWSEEEHQIIEDAACIILDCVNTVETKKEEERLEELADKLQNLRPQSQWKPSDEQMKALDDVISSRDIKYDVLSELWKDLEKLRE